MKANEAVFEKMREDEIMCEALREFFEPEIEQRLKEASEKGMQQFADIQQKLKDGETKEGLIGQGYEKSIVDRAYTLLFN
jgi:hypothetical protein